MIKNSIDIIVRIQPTEIRDILKQYSEQEINNFTQKDITEILCEEIKDYLKPHLADFSCNSTSKLKEKLEKIKEVVNAVSYLSSKSTRLLKYDIESILKD